MSLLVKLIEGVVIDSARVVGLRIIKQESETEPTKFLLQYESYDSDGNLNWETIEETSYEYQLDSKMDNLMHQINFARRS